MKRLILLFLAFLLTSGICFAHSQRLPSGERNGLPFESVSHGELVVLERHSASIFKLAHSSTQTDLTFRRLMNYASIEYSYCLWGLAPRAALDEASPFNECTHAYLSAQKALLLYMRSIPDVKRQAGELISKIDEEAVLSGAALIGCVFTGEQFTTAEFVTPHWELLIGHWPSLLALALVVSLTVIVLATTAYFLRQTP
jgi:hypothetical protein